MLLDVLMSGLLFSVLDLCSIYQILPGLSVNTSYSKRIYLTSLSVGFLVRYRWVNSLCADVFVHQRMDYRPLSQGTQRQFMGVLKQWPLVTNLFDMITRAVNSEREKEDSLVRRTLLQ